MEEVAARRSTFCLRPDGRSLLCVPALTEPLAIAGPPIVNLIASTSGTDSDWVVKLIDVYPEEVPSRAGDGRL